jgi:hypothetical protein
MERASQALIDMDYFTCERLALQALEKSRAKHDYERIARILMPLQEARRQKRLAAIDSGHLLQTSKGEDLAEVPTPGCYVLEPLLVGADGRNLRERADEAGVPIFVVVREPVTATGQWPIVMIGPITVRTRVAPPKDDTANIQWMLTASEALGDEAISNVKDTLDPGPLAEALLDRLGTCPEHEKLHQACAEACKAAAKAKAEASSK